MRGPGRHRITGFCALLIVGLTLAGCASSGPRSTRITQSDLDATVSEMVASLAGSDFLRNRTADSPPIVIVTNKVENLTDDVIPISEQWMLVARLQSEYEAARARLQLG